MGDHTGASGTSEQKCVLLVLFFFSGAPNTSVHSQIKKIVSNYMAGLISDYKDSSEVEKHSTVTSVEVNCQMEHFSLVPPFRL